MTKQKEQTLINDIKLKGNIPSHVAIIMDGNRRWARQQGLDIQDGHIKGALKIEEIIDAAMEINVKMLTLYAFSSENWNRNKIEVEYLISILKEYLDSEYINKLIFKNVKLLAIGDINKFDNNIVERIKEIEKKTCNNTDLTLCLTLSYSGREEIIRMVRLISEQVKSGLLNIEEINENVVNQNMYLNQYTHPDLIIRSGGEKRISNFLLWYIAYSELYFTDKMWPDLNKIDFLTAIADYQLRERRYGSI